MFTVQQKALLDLLKDFKCLRYSHIQRYMAAKYGSTDEHVTKMLEQLRFRGKLQTNDDYVSLPGRKANTGYIKAFDVVLGLTNGKVESISQGIEPFVLMFSVKTDTDAINDFGVVIAQRHCENNICRQLSIFGPEVAVIFVLYEHEQQKLLKVENKCYYAIQDENDGYRFFKNV